MTRLPSTAPTEPTRRRRWRGRALCALLPAALFLLAGCATGGFTPPWRAAEPKKDAPKNEIVQTGLIADRYVIDPELQKEFDKAKALFDQKKYDEAIPIFHKVYQLDYPWYYWNALGAITGDALADGALDSEETRKAKQTVREKNTKRKFSPICEAAIFYEAECQRLQKNFREAEFTYTKVLADYPRSQYATRVRQGLFEIADHWLEPTRKQMDEYQEQIQGKRWFVAPAMWVHWGNDMPFLDTEGHATQVLNTVRLHDIKGPMGEKALLYLGTISFFRQDYKEADFYFTQIFQEYPNSDHAAKALKQSVICKQLVTGGPIYDCRGVEESKKLLLTSMGAYPELAKDERWVSDQLKSINLQQADRDMKIAELYQRMDHPGAAYFYYEIVCRRYPGTTYCATATQRKQELRVKVEKEQKTAPTAPLPASARARAGSAASRLKAPLGSMPSMGPAPR